MAEITPEVLAPAVEALLRTEDWDTVTVKLIMRKLETALADGADLAPGWIAPHKKLIKQIVDDKMTAILAERNGEAGEASAGASEPGGPAIAGTAAAPAAEQPARQAEPPRARDDATGGTGAQAGRKRPASDTDGAAPAAREAPQPAAEAEAEARRGTPAASSGGEEGNGAEEGGKEERGERGAGTQADGAGDDGDDTARFVGKPIATRNGKVHYSAWRSEGVTYRLGMDVYLEPSSDAEALPYVARLVDIYAYAFAADEVYFNARWYYRDADVRQYGLLDAARAESLRAAEGELYMSLHEDENHADTVLRAAKVCVLQGKGPAPLLEQHEYFVRYAYDAQAMFDITDATLVPKKKLRAAVVQELARQPDMSALRKSAQDAKRQRTADVERLDAAEAESKRRKATVDELRAIALTRRTIEVRGGLAPCAAPRAAPNSLASIPPGPLPLPLTASNLRACLWPRACRLAASDLARRRQPRAAARAALRARAVRPAAQLGQGAFHALRRARSALVPAVQGGRRGGTRARARAPAACARPQGNARALVGSRPRALFRSLRPAAQCGKRVSTIALWVRTGQGRKLVRLDALSNEPFTQQEFDEFIVPITSYAARDKADKLRGLTQRNASLFSEEEQRQMDENDARLQERLERERAEAARREEEDHRREREREELRDRLAQKKVETSEQWWKTHAITADVGVRERAKWAARLRRFEAIAASSKEEGERTNAARLASAARKKLEEIS